MDDRRGRRASRPLSQTSGNDPTGDRRPAARDLDFVADDDDAEEPEAAANGEFAVDEENALPLPTIQGQVTGRMQHGKPRAAWSGAIGVSEIVGRSRIADAIPDGRMRRAKNGAVGFRT